MFLFGRVGMLRTDVYKVCIAGESGVGKTYLLRRYEAPETFDPKSIAKSTIGVDFTMKHFLFDETTSVTVQLWDTAGQERFNALSGNYFRGAMALACVLDLSRPETLDALDRWIDAFYLATGKRSDAKDSDSPAILLLGNKADLVPADAEIISIARQRAESFGWYFYTVSAITGSNVTEAFDEFMKVVHRRYGSRTVQPTMRRGSISRPPPKFDLVYDGSAVRSVDPRTGSVIAPRRPSSLRAAAGEEEGEVLRQRLRKTREEKWAAHMELEELDEQIVREEQKRDSVNREIARRRDIILNSPPEHPVPEPFVSPVIKLEDAAPPPKEQAHGCCRF